MAAGSVYPRRSMTKSGHRKFGLFAHITWHTWRRERTVQREDASVVTRTILAAADRNAVHVLSQAVLSDHVHVVVSFRPDQTDRKSTRLNSSHSSISYAVFCLKKK